jgi:hypothetical protein
MEASPSWPTISGRTDHVGHRLSARGRLIPVAPKMIREQLEPLSPAARHQVLAGGAMGFYGLH